MIYLRKENFQVGRENNWSRIYEIIEDFLGLYEGMRVKRDGLPGYSFSDMVHVEELICASKEVAIEDLSTGLAESFGKREDPVQQALEKLESLEDHPGMELDPEFLALYSDPAGETIKYEITANLVPDDHRIGAAIKARNYREVSDGVLDWTYLWARAGAERGLERRRGNTAHMRGSWYTEARKEYAEKLDSWYGKTVEIEGKIELSEIQ